MYALSLGIGEIDDVLPGLVYALLSGLNASIVGIIALSAVQVSALSHFFFFGSRAISHVTHTSSKY